jgi:hypothetical protein
VKPGGTPEEAGGEGRASLFTADGDSRVAIYRRDDMTKKYVYHGILAMEEATETFVGGLFGGGHYRAQLRVVDDAGRPVIKRSHDFSLPGAYKPPTGELPGSPALASTPGAPGRTAASFSTLPPGVSAGEALNSALVGSVIDLLKGMKDASRPTTPTIDWGPVIAGGTTILTALVTKLIERPATDSKAEMLELLERFAAIVKAPVNQPGPAASGISDAVEAIRSLLEVKDMISGGGEKPDATDQMLAGLPKLIEVMANQGRPPKRALPSETPLPADTPMWKRMLLGQRKGLLRSAAMGVEADFAADVALTYLPQELTGTVKEFLAMPNHVELAMETIPELRSYSTWTHAFFQSLSDAINAPEEVEAPDASAEG